MKKFDFSSVVGISVEAETLDEAIEEHDRIQEEILRLIEYSNYDGNLNLSFYETTEITQDGKKIDTPLRAPY
jgi:hypothetical protein